MRLLSVHAAFLPGLVKITSCAVFMLLNTLTLPLLTFFLLYSTLSLRLRLPPPSLFPSLLTAESRLAPSPPPSLGSACRRPTPTTSEASGWPWPRSLASRASLDSISHATRWRRQQRRRRRPPPPPEPPRVGGGKWKRGPECFSALQVIVCSILSYLFIICLVIIHVW